MKKIFCFGEVLLRLSPGANGHWLQHNQVPVYVGGAELNVATALAKWNMPVKYATALPENYLSRQVDEFIAAKNIDTSAIHYSGQRIGLYYLQQGADMKNAGVIYDRAHSSFAELQPGMIDWDTVLQNVSWFHCSAISPALSLSAVEVCKEGLQVASSKGITTSIDLNYRPKLWQYGKKPIEVMPHLVSYCNVIMGNIWAANTLLGIPVDPHIHESHLMKSYLDHATETAGQLQRQFSNCTTVANTFRFDKGDHGIRYFSTLNQGNAQYVSPEFTTDTIVDKVGSGDCFMAGLIYGLSQQHPPQQVINFSASAAFGKLQERGDITRQETQTILQRLEQHG